MNWYSHYGKRLFDCTVALIATVALLPVLAIVAIAVRLKLGSPVLFHQTRIGRNGKPFRIYKFRTMTSQTDAHGQLLPDEQRLTRFGRLLRSTSLDELPELWNILRGEMSFVGPRPLPPSYMPLYTPRQNTRHDVVPGLTGLAQVNGRNNVNWAMRLAMDAWYVQHQGCLLDIKILSQTFTQVIARKDICAEGHATMPAFQGAPDLSESEVARQLGVTNHRESGCFVIGCGGHAKVVISACRAAKIPVLGIYDDYAPMWGKTVCGIPVLGPVKELSTHAHPRAIIAIGDGAVRLRIAAGLPHASWQTVIHPSAVVDSTASIEDGTVIMAGTVIQTDVRIGKHVIVNTGATIDHDCQIADGSHLAPGTTLAGNVKVGEQCFLGVGTKVIPGMTIGNGTVVGAGGVVVRHLPAGMVCVGCPAKPIKQVATTRFENSSGSGNTSVAA